MSRWFSGQATYEDREHVRQCFQCRSELERYETALAGFRGAVRQWSAGELAAPRQLKPARPRAASYVLQACLALTLILAGVESLHMHRLAQGGKPGQPVLQASPLANGDDILLDEVNADVARQVPTGMERLLPLLPSADQETEPR